MLCLIIILLYSFNKSETFTLIQCFVFLLQNLGIKSTRYQAWSQFCLCCLAQLITVIVGANDLGPGYRFSSMFVVVLSNQDLKINLKKGISHIVTLGIWWTTFTHFQVKSPPTDLFYNHEPIFTSSKRAIVLYNVSYS